ncbi:MAG TPA: hypothetical protein VKE98_11595, partial [Gemmataceae bacterium]|nr:hypothetical protein [Gemmataceae bacterium]
TQVGFHFVRRPRGHNHLNRWALGVFERDYPMKCRPAQADIRPTGNSQVHICWVSRKVLAFRVAAERAGFDKEPASGYFQFRPWEFQTKGNVT